MLISFPCTRSDGTLTTRCCWLHYSVWSTYLSVNQPPSDQQHTTPVTLRLFIFTLFFTHHHPSSTINKPLPLPLVVSFLCCCSVTRSFINDSSLYLLLLISSQLSRLPWSICLCRTRSLHLRTAFFHHFNLPVYGRGPRIASIRFYDRPPHRPSRILPRNVDVGESTITHFSHTTLSCCDR